MLGMTVHCHLAQGAVQLEVAMVETVVDLKTNSCRLKHMAHLKDHITLVIVLTLFLFLHLSQYSNN